MDSGTGDVTEETGVADGAGNDAEDAGSDAAITPISEDGGVDAWLPDGAFAVCSVNADCLDTGMRFPRCPLQIYCLDGCRWNCVEFCTPIRSDINPCREPELCGPLWGSGTPPSATCLLVPVKCRTEADCPLYLPPVEDGGRSAWTCDDGGICRYPGYMYPTN